MTIPTAVAMAEAENLTGRELIEAVVIGYDIFIRLGSAINPDLLLRGFHTTATVGAFASAAAASKLLGLNRLQTENALALAGLQGAGLLEALGSGDTGKPFQVGKAAQAGVLAALLAQRGADGPVDILEGEKGFFRAFADKACPVEAICEKLGALFQIKGVYFKKHAACRHIHPALDAVAEFAARHELRIGEIEAIEIETYTIAKNLTGHLTGGTSELAAKFSMPVAVALLLVFGASDASVYRKKYVSDPNVQAVARKVTVSANPRRDRSYPKKRGAGVTVRMKKQPYRHEVDYPRGEPENPLGDDELMHKYEKNTRSLYSRGRADIIRDAILTLESIAIPELAELLKAPPGV